MMHVGIKTQLCQQKERKTKTVTDTETETKIGGKTDRLRQMHTERIRSGSQTLIWVLWSASPAMETICADGLKLVTKASNVFPS